MRSRASSLPRLRWRSSFSGPPPPRVLSEQLVELGEPREHRLAVGLRRGRGRVERRRERGHRGGPYRAAIRSGIGRRSDGLDATWSFAISPSARTATSAPRRCMSDRVRCGRRPVQRGVEPRRQRREQRELGDALGAERVVDLPPRVGEDRHVLGQVAPPARRSSFALKNTTSRIDPLSSAARWRWTWQMLQPGWRAR